MAVEGQQAGGGARRPGAGAPPRAAGWAAALARDTSAIAAFLVERSDRADELRQSSPFAGALSPRERWTLWRTTRDRLARES
jgi:hypothetical protein